MKIKRRARNYLIDPPLQLRLCAWLLWFHLILAGVLFSAYAPLLNILKSIFVASSIAPVEANMAMQQAGEDLVTLFFTIFGLFCLFSTAIFIMLSHRIAGAVFAINRHVREKLLREKYGEPVVLRKGDLLKPLAESLNELGKKLAKQQGMGAEKVS